MATNHALQADERALHSRWAHLLRHWGLLLTLVLAGVLLVTSAEGQTPWKPGLEASRYILSYGRLDSLRVEGIAGIAPDTRPDKFYRNIPGLTGPGGVFAIIASPPPPFTPQLVSFDMDATGARNGVLDGSDLLIAAGQFLPPGFSLLIHESDPVVPATWKWEGFVRFGEGNFYATVAIPGTDIVPGVELYTKEQFQAYTANSILWEAPDFGDIVVDTELDGGTVNIEANRSVRQLGYANPMNLDIVIQSQRELPNGSCRVTLQGRLMNSFGNPVAPGPPSGYTWFRWAFEDNSGSRIMTVPFTPFVTVDVPITPGQDGGDQIKVSLVASSWGPGVVTSTLPGVAPATQPFVLPPEPPVPVGLATFHSRASSLQDTETISRGACEKQPLRVSKSANPATVGTAGGDVTFEVTISNGSTKDAVTIASVVDDRLGDIGPNCTPPLPATLDHGQTMTCKVTAKVAGAADSTVTDTITVRGGYTDDGTPVEGTATVGVKIGPAAGPGGPAGNLAQSIVILLDASGSMGDNNKIDQAKASASQTLDRLGSGTEVALIVFYDCGSIVVEQEFTTNVAAVEGILPRIKPSGSTPLAAAIGFAKDYIRQKASGAVADLIVLSDGKETCGGDPVAAASR